MTEKKPLGLAIVGCGYVADFYMATLTNYPALHIVGVYDKDPDRLKVFCEYFSLTSFASMEDLLKDEKVSIVLNLTNPRSHYKITRQCLDANKHVYSEKPLAMTYEKAKDLVEHAKAKGLKLSSAPCSVLSKAAKTLSYAVREKMAGEIKLVYAELDDGLVHKMPYKRWISESGAPWPYRDEFEVGCTLEHAGYFLGWLIEIFGSVKSVTAFSDCVVPEKVGPEPPLNPPDTADISFGLLKFESGVVVRLSTTIVAPHDHSIRLIGDKGVLYLNECWNNNDPVYFRRLVQIRRKTFLSPIKKKVKLPYPAQTNKYGRSNTKMDFLLGVQDLVEAVETGTDGQLHADFSLHVNEVALALQYAGVEGKTYFTKSRI